MKYIYVTLLRRAVSKTPRALFNIFYIAIYCTMLDIKYVDKIILYELT